MRALYNNIELYRFAGACDLVAFFRRDGCDWDFFTYRTREVVVKSEIKTFLAIYFFFRVVKRTLYTGNIGFANTFTILLRHVVLFILVGSVIELASAIVWKSYQ